MSPNDSFDFIDVVHGSWADAVLGIIISAVLLVLVGVGYSRWRDREP